MRYVRAVDGRMSGASSFSPNALNSEKDKCRPSVESPLNSGKKSMRGDSTLDNE